MDWAAVRADALRELRRRDAALWLVGTAHGDHWEQDVYGIGDVVAALANLRPDLVLIESREEEIAAGNATDGPPEMHVVRLLAAERGIPVVGVDHWELTADTRPMTTSAARDDEIARRVIRAVDGRPDSRRAALFIGFGHLEALSARLARRGWSVRAVTPARTAEVFDRGPGPVRMPPGLRDVLAERVRRELADAERFQRLNPVFSAQMRENAAYFRALLDGRIAPHTD